MTSPGQSRPLFSMENITVKLGGNLVFEDTSWTARQNEHWVIIGPNGSGKTLLSGVIYRTVALFKGQIRYHFDDKTDPATPRTYFNKGEIIRVSHQDHQKLLDRFKSGYHQARWQSFEGHDVPTVSDLLTGKSIEHVSRYEITPIQTPEAVYRERRENAIRMLNIGHILDRKFTQLSNGESRKTMIARALMQSPKVLILDDPLNGLDKKSRHDFMEGVEELIESNGPVVLYITPRPYDIPKGITRYVQLKELRIEKLGNIAEFVQEANTRRRSQAILADFPQHISSEFNRNKTSESRQTIIEIKDTSVSYGKTKILSHINWTVKSGEKWAVLGPNGAGKSTLLSLILGDNPQAYANDIVLFGKKRGSGESIWDIKKQIGWVSSELQLFYKLDSTCHNVICSGYFDTVGLYQDYSRQQSDTARWWMRSMGIEHLADQAMGKASAGEQRLILIARALIKAPALLVLDEPCQSLDNLTRDRIVRFLEYLCDNVAISLIYVTHYEEEIPASVSQVLRLENGRVVYFK